MRYVLAIATAAAVLLSGVSAPVFAAGKTAAREEAKLTMDQLPAPVKATLEKEAKDGSIGEVTQETKNGKMYYEAQIHRKNGKDRYVHVAPDGKVLKRESARKEMKERAKEPAASVR
jgi:uncharacterized membrane protein YkoI